MPDFAQYYGLRLTEVVAEYEPCEAILLISGLPGASRYAARHAGEANGGGWDSRDWLALDTRNAIEALRATVANWAAGKNKDTFHPWTHYPGYDRQVKRKAAGKLDRLRGMATSVTE